MGRMPTVWEAPHHAVLLLLVVLGGLLRFKELGHESLWLDEGFTWALVSQPFSQVFELVLQDIHPPLYYIVEKLWVGPFGTSEVSLRLPAALFSLGTIPLVYLLGRDMADRFTGLGAAGMVTFAEFQVLYAQEARMYAMLGFFTALSFLYYHRLLSRGYSRRRVIGYLAATVAALYTHVFGLLVLAAQNVHWLAHTLVQEPGWDRVRPWAKVQGATALLFAPWVYPLYLQSQRVTDGFWVGAPSPESLVKSLEAFAGSEPLLYLLLPAAVLGLLYRGAKEGPEDALDLEAPGRTERGPSGRGLLLAWVAVPLLAAYIVSQVLTSVYLTRYLIVASLPLFLLAARGIAVVDQIAPRAGLLVLLVGLLALNAQGIHAEHTKEEWREAATYIDERAGFGELVIFDGFSTQLPFDYYSKDPLDKRGYLGSHPLAEGAAIQDLSNVSQVHARVWVVLSHASHTREIHDALLEDFELTNTEHFNAIEVRTYRQGV